MFAGGFSLRAWGSAALAQDGLGLVSKMDWLALAIGLSAYCKVVDEKANKLRNAPGSFVQALSGAVAGIWNLFWAYCFGSLAEIGAKPWLSGFFHMLLRPTLRFLQLDRRKVAELA